MAADAKQAAGARSTPAAFESFRFLARELDAGRARHAPLRARRRARASPSEFSCPSPAPLDAERDRARRRAARAAALGRRRQLLQDRAARRGRAARPAPPRARGGGAARGALLGGARRVRVHEPAGARCRARASPRAAARRPARAPARRASRARVLVPVGGGKDSAVALEIVAPLGLRAGAVLGRRRAADRPHRRRSPGLPRLHRARASSTRGSLELQRARARSTATCRSPRSSPASALLTRRAERLRRGRDGQRALGLGAATSRWDGVEVNHQFSKSLRGRAAAARGRRGDSAAPARRSRSCAPPPSSRSRARSRGMERYHGAFTSCNAIFRLDPALRAASWCCDCPKCRFVFLALAPFSEPAHLREIFGARPARRRGASSRASRCSRPPAATSRSSASARSRRASPRCGCWRPTSAGASTRVVRRLVARGARRASAPARATPRAVLALSDEHDVPDGAAGRRACASRSLTARASASGAPAARSARSPRSCARAPARRADRRGGVRRAARRADARAGAARAPACASSAPPRRRDGARAAAMWSCARRASRSTAPSCARCARAGVPVTTATVAVARRARRRAA